MTQIEITTMLQNIVKKSGKTIEEVQAKYDEIFENTPPGDQQTKVAIKQTNKELSNKSSAVSIQAVIVGIDRLFDFNDKKILNALELYNRDPSQAIASKAVKLDKDDKPIVLDQTEVWSTGTKNRRFGKPLPHSWNRNCIILLHDPETGSYEAGRLSLQGTHATGELPPLNVLLDFKATGDLEKGFRTSEKATKYSTVKILSNEDLKTLIASEFSTCVKSLGELRGYHDSFTPKSAEFYNMVVITSGEVAYAKESEDVKNSHYLMLDDATTDRIVPCYLSGHLPCPDIDSEVTIIGKTNLGKGWDSENQVQTDEEVIQLNGSGIIPA